MADMAGDHRDFPVDVDREAAAKAFDGLLTAIMDNAVGEYFLQQAERPPVDDGNGGDFIILCPGFQFKAYGLWNDLGSCEFFLDNEHFKDGTGEGGSLCDNQVDYDMHGIAKLEKVGIR